MNKMVRIDNDVDNRLLNRREVKVTLDVEGAVPSRKEVKEKLSKELDVDENLLIVEKIESIFGSRQVEVIAYVYDDEASLKTITLKHIYKRNQTSGEEEQAQEA